MKKFLNRIILFIILINLFFAFSLSVSADENNLDISTDNVILMDYETGKVLYEKNMDEKIYPASTTKIMTAILVLENCNLNDTVTISESAINSVEYGYVTGNLKAGETFTVEQMLYLLMVPSANDAAFALAEHVSGSTESFAELMNNKAIELGCTNTHFVNPNGIHNENHYTTAHDLGVIARYALSNPTFREIVTYTSYKLPATEIYQNDNRIFANTNDMISPYSNYYYKYATGIKTGYTSSAGYCLVSSAENNNLKLISVVVGAKSNEKKYLDTKNLFEYGFENYSVEEVTIKNTALQSINIKNATSDTKKLNAIVENTIYAIVKNDYNQVIIPEIKLKENLKAPISKGEIIGSVTYNIDNLSYSSNLIASHDVKKSYLFLYIFILVFVSWIIVRLIKIIFKKKRKNHKIKKTKRQY